MKKYFFIFKSEVMSNLQYIFNIIAGFISFFIMIYIFLNLWKYIYSDPNELINGYTMNDMIWYVIITEILWGILGGRKYCKRIINDVRSGNIAYNINKPYNYIGYCLSNKLGECLTYAVMYITLGLLLGFIFLKSFPNINIIGLLCVLLSGILATIISILLITFISLFSFIIEDANPFYWVYSKLILVIGTIFPIEFFPKFVQLFLKFSPVYVACYGPAKLFVNFSYLSFATIIGMQLIYILIAWLLCTLIYRKGVKNLNVNGG